MPESGAQASASAWRATLAERLPPYMVPSRFEILPSMPRLTSGKIDRKALKALPLSAAAQQSGESDIAETPAEQALFAALATLFPGQPIRRSDDFFSDLGGHSFFAARLASMLRADPRFAHITVRDIYQRRVIARIAEGLAEAQEQTLTSDTDWTPPSALRRWTCGVAQAAAIPALVTLRMVQWLAPFFTYHFLTGDPTDSIPLAIAASVAVFLLATLFEFAVAIGGKWLIAGRLKPGRYPLWGVTYYRWWLADRLVESAPAYLLSGSSLYVWWLRSLGARVGKDATIGSMTLRCPDLLDIGNEVSIGNACNFENARVEHGELWLGKIVLGDDAYVGSTVLEGNTMVKAWGHLEAQSALGDGVRFPIGRVWSGSPARDVGALDTSKRRQRPPVSKRRLVGEAIYFMAGVLVIAVLFFMPVFPTFVLIDWFDEAEIMPWLLGDDISIQLLRYLILAFPGQRSAGVVHRAGFRRHPLDVLPRLKPGSWPVHSNTYCGKWLVSQIQESSLNVLHGIYATVYAPFWYRLLGARWGATPKSRPRWASCPTC